MIGWTRIMSSPPARKDRNFRHLSVLREARRVNGLTKDRIAERDATGGWRRKTLQTTDFFSTMTSANSSLKKSQRERVEKPELSW
jgi:hypothetical protein